MGMEQLLAALREPPELLRRLAHIPDLYIVGGLLRDAWWGEATRDLDLAAPAPLEPVLAAVEAALGGTSFELNKRFASYRLVHDDWELDISPLHHDGLAADIQRRDYTVNAVAAPVARLGPGFQAGDIACHSATLDDLAGRRLRMVSRANLAADPLRILRGYRLAATRGLTPEAQTRAAWRELAPRLSEAAPERVHDELLRWFSAATAVDSIEWCAADGVLWEIFPELKATDGCAQNNYHHLDVWQHTLVALRGVDLVRSDLPAELRPWQAELDAAWDAPVSGAATAGTLTRLALLLHDIGKPPTREVQPDGRISFHTHQDVGAELLEPLLDSLKFATVERDFMVQQVREHLRLGFYSDHLPLSPRLVYRFLKSLKQWTPVAVLHALADCSATLGMDGDGGWDQHVAAGAQLLGPFFARSTVAEPPVLLDGEAIKQLLDLPPGRIIGELKGALLEATAAGEVNTVAEAESFVRECYQRLQ